MTTLRLEVLAALPVVVLLLGWFDALRRARRPVLLVGGEPPAELPGPPLRTYADARTDAPPGEEGPPIYLATVALGKVAWAELAARPVRSLSRAELQALGAGSRARQVRRVVASMLQQLRASPELYLAFRAFSADAEAYAELRRRLGRPRVLHRRDGIRLGDEGTDELLEEIFGSDTPT